MIPSILVLGPSHSGRKSLATRLALSSSWSSSFSSSNHAYQSLPTSEQDEQQLQEGIIAQGEDDTDQGMSMPRPQGKWEPHKQVVENVLHAMDWKIDTKYYSAQVQVCVESEPFALMENLEDERAKAFLRTVQAVILVFDSSSQESFEQMKSFVKIIDMFSPETVLCASNKADLARDKAESHRKVQQEWCQEKGIEYVETNSIEASVEQGTGEKEGISRVMEALHVTMWSNMTRKELKPNRPNELGGEHETAPSSPNTGEDNDPPGEEAEDEDLEALFDMVRDMRNIKHQLQGLSDDERRKQAEEMTFRLLGEYLKMEDQLEE